MATVRIKFRYSSLLDAGVVPCQIRVTINIAVALSDAIREVKPGRRDGLGAVPAASTAAPIANRVERSISRAPFTMEFPTTTTTQGSFVEGSISP